MCVCVCMCLCVCLCIIMIVIIIMTTGLALGSLKQLTPPACAQCMFPRHTLLVTHHTSRITRHTSHITHRTSHVTRYTSHVTRHTSQGAVPPCCRSIWNRVFASDVSGLSMSSMISAASRKGDDDVRCGFGIGCSSFVVLWC